MKLLLVAVHPYPSPQAIPLAAAFLKGALAANPRLKREVSCDIVELFALDDPARGVEQLLSCAPEAIAFSMYVWNRVPILEMARLLRLKCPSLLLIAGGPEPTADPAALLLPGYFDALILGEGEITFPLAITRVLDGLPLSDIPGIAVAGEKSLLPPPPPEPEQIPSPYLDGTLVPTGGAALWQIARGCDFACAFCFDHRGERVRRFPMERLERELALFVSAGVEQVFVLDSTFNKIPARAKEILALIERVAPKVHFHFEVRSEFIDGEMAELFARIVCSLQIGLQSSDPEVMSGVGRPFDAARFASRIDLLNQSGAIFGFDLIYGLPGDTLARFRYSLDFALSLYPNHLDIFPLAVLPGTRLFGKAAGLKLDHLPAPPYTVRALPGFPPEDLARARALAVACDLFYSRGKAVAWFNAVLRALKLIPAQFLANLAGWLGEKGDLGEETVADEEILPIQQAFLGEIFKKRKKERLLPVALDLVQYHHQYARALLAPPTLPLSKKRLKGIDPLQVPLKLSDSAALAAFNFEILELLEEGEVELAPFASRHKPCGSYAVIYPGDREICTEALSPPYFHLLETLDGVTCAATRLGKGELSPREAREFLEFALAEGFVTLSHR